MMKIDTTTANSNPIAQIQIMPATPTTTKSRREPRDTGFPEPFHGERNTTLPHPDADLSPNACISQDDIHPDRIWARRHHSFLHKKKRPTLRSGRIDTTTESLDAVFKIVTSHTTDMSDTDSVRHANSPTVSTVRFSKDGTDSLRSRNSVRDEDTPPTSPDVPSHRAKKGGLLRKLRMQ